MTGRGSGPNRVRITGGRFRGRFVAVPSGARPTVGRVREALFSIWVDALPDARLLELFAGSGVVSCEALGRGARSAVLVDASAAVARWLGENVAGLDLEDAATVYRMTLPRDLVRFDGQAFDLVFADPPYSFTGHTALLAAVAPLLAEGGEVVLEHGARAGSPSSVAGLERIDQRVYGESALSRYRRR